MKSAQVKTNLTAGAWQGDQTQTYTARAHANGIVDQVKSTATTKVSGTNPASSSVEYTFDVLNRLRTITRGSTVETLRYGPTGELVAKQVGDTWTFWVGDYATITAKITITGTTYSATERKLDAHVIFAGTRIASLGTPAGATSARTLYYYRSRLGTVVATSLAGGVVGAKYRYTPYGAVDAGATTGDADLSKRSELGYTNALRLSGNLLHLKTRAYDPELRVFLQVDSVDRLRYAYTRGDPANYSDPTGMEPGAYNETELTIIMDGVVIRDPTQQRLLEGYAGETSRLFRQIVLESDAKSVRWRDLGIRDWWGTHYDDFARPEIAKSLAAATALAKEGTLLALQNPVISAELARNPLFLLNWAALMESEEFLQLLQEAGRAGRLGSVIRMIAHSLRTGGGDSSSYTTPDAPGRQYAEGAGSGSVVGIDLRTKDNYFVKTNPIWFRIAHELLHAINNAFARSDRDRTTDHENMQPRTQAIYRQLTDAGLLDQRGRVWGSPEDSQYQFRAAP